MERCILDKSKFCLPGEDGRVNVMDHGEVTECMTLCSKRFRFEKLAEMKDSIKSIEEMADMVTGRPVSLGC